MRFSINWLKDFIDFDVPPEGLAEKLTMAGLEVEELVRVGAGLRDVVVAEITAQRPHPEADKLTLCDVTDGERSYEIVCGATNMKTGDKVALATAGTTLPPSEKFPDGLELKKTNIRGVVSMGMLCAENELGLGEESEGIMILPTETGLGESLAEALDLEDTVIEIGVTPNRADCLSVVGVARELGAMLGSTARRPETQPTEQGEDIEGVVSVTVEDTEGCPRYSCRVIKGVKIGPTPHWLAKRVEASGIRSINNVVDVTNYVLLELGQPLHAFDYDLIEGGAIIVRPAREEEKITTLDGAHRTLCGDDLLICDASRPVALAGVMGGATSEVTEETVNILLESAYFNPSRVRRMSKRANLRSESSYRFERGVDPNGVVRALDRAAKLIREVAGGDVARGSIDIYPSPVEPCTVKLRAERANSLLGTDIPIEKITSILSGLGMEVEQTSEGELHVRVPTFRVDIEREVDLIEEVARHWGYDKIPTTTPRALMALVEGENRTNAVASRAREILTGAGFLEAINYSFEDPELLYLYSAAEQVNLLNPLTRESSAMRTTLLAGIMKNIAMNLNRHEEDLRVFEVGRCYVPTEQGGLPKETLKVSGAATGKRGIEFWDKVEYNFYDLKGVMENLFDSLALSATVSYEEVKADSFLHPGRSAMITIKGEEVGFMGEIHPRIQERLDISKSVYVFELDLDKLSELSASAPRALSPLPRFPSLRRDLALIVNDNLIVGDILKEISKIKTPYIEEASVFDVFTGKPIEEGKKSVAVSIVLRATDKTLTDEEANSVQNKILKKLEGALGTELRKT
ncbi:MAG: phenylalanine--tRNA ligase subunit beta [Candidatus Dadabacteria bacterium]|nr:phenylalanine--tRNA ligase subunit beta [Candidatus Dadabacteria bacterium]